MRMFTLCIFQNPLELRTEERPVDGFKQTQMEISNQIWWIALLDSTEQSIDVNMDKTGGLRSPSIAPRVEQVRAEASS